MASKKLDMIPFLTEEDKVAGTSVRRSGGQAHPITTTPPSTSVILTKTFCQPPSSLGSGKRKSLEGPHQGEPSHKKGQSSKDQALLLPPPPPGIVGQNYARLANAYVAEADMHVWSKESMEMSNASLTKAAAKMFFLQASRHKQMRALASSNDKLSSELANLKSKSENDMKVSEEAWKKKLAGATDDLKKKLRDEVSSRDKLELAHVTEKKRLDSQVKGLSNRVALLEREAKDANVALSTVIKEAEARGSVNFMKGFLKKIDDFDWYRLGEATGIYADNLRKKMGEEAAEKAMGGGDDHEAP